ncbi:MAG: hypothetical protein IJW82_05500 [Clostridia bacterium]|nr:hypothetical protein [Clostridia bacterium]
MRIINETLKCACCGKESEQEILLSYSTMGSPDLDYKATGMASRAFVSSLQICPTCNYVAGDIAEKVQENLFAQRKDYYQEAIKECDKMELDLDVRKFYLMGLINEENDRQQDASDDYIFAYWLTERSNEKLAAKFLKRAITLRSKNYNKLTKRIALQTLDLLRRNGNFEEVINECTELLQNGKIGEDAFTENEIKQLKYEIKICKLKDTDRHNYFDVAMDDEL